MSLKFVRRGGGDGGQRAQEQREAREDWAQFARGEFKQVEFPCAVCQRMGGDNSVFECDDTCGPCKAEITDD